MWGKNCLNLYTGTCINLCIFIIKILLYFWASSGQSAYIVPVIYRDKQGRVYLNLISCARAWLCWSCTYRVTFTELFFLKLSDDIYVYYVNELLNAGL